MEIHNLKLVAALFYVQGEKDDPFAYREGSGEKLYCFSLDEKEAMDFEPDRDRLIGPLIFCGVAAGDAAIKPSEEKERESMLSLPAGEYIFAQEREVLSGEDIVNMAVEIQMEALWQRLVPGKTLYLRYLFEDGRSVTQLFRPIDAGRAR